MFIKKESKINENLTIDDKNLTIDDKNLTIDNIILKDIIKKINTSNYKSDVKNKLLKITNEFFKKQFWGRSDIMKVIKCSSGASYNIINYLLELDLIELVTGHGKSKYKFNNSFNNKNIL